MVSFWLFLYFYPCKEEERGKSKPFSGQPGKAIIDHRGGGKRVVIFHSQSKSLKRKNAILHFLLRGKWKGGGERENCSIRKAFSSYAI